MEIYFGVLLALVGLLIGSFLNVVDLARAGGESVVSPPLALPAVRYRDPAAGQHPGGRRGCCCGDGAGDCGTPISARYPLVELGLHRPVRSSWLAASGGPWELPAYLYLASVGLALAVIDLDTKRLPGRR